MDRSVHCQFDPRLGIHSMHGAFRNESSDQKDLHQAVMFRTSVFAPDVWSVRPSIRPFLLTDIRPS